MMLENRMNTICIITAKIKLMMAILQKIEQNISAFRQDLNFL